MKLLLHKLFHWEYWPFQVVYIPIYFLWLYYSFKAKSIFFFNASNPTIKNGGFIMEQKKLIYELIPQQYYPKTEFVKQGTALDEIYFLLEKSNIQFPFIVKPDIGLRGSAVKKIHSKADLESYHQKANFDYLLQDLIPYQNEVGIFYVRYPNEKLGRITGIVSKEFMIVTGDGISTIEALIKKNPRYELQLKALKKELGNELLRVLQNGEKFNLMPYGNHARGAKFIDFSHKINDTLTQTMNEMCSQIAGFYFGRLDIMYNNWEELEQGKNFKVVELNGAASEPTHIYDPKHTLFFAWKELARHIGYMYNISAENNKSGFSYLSFKEGMEQYRLHLEQSKKIVDF